MRRKNRNSKDSAAPPPHRARMTDKEHQAFVRKAERLQKVYEKKMRARRAAHGIIHDGDL